MILSRKREFRVPFFAVAAQGGINAALGNAKGAEVDSWGETEEILIEPLPRLRVLKDLVVDTNRKHVCPKGVPPNLTIRSARRALAERALAGMEREPPDEDEKE